MQLRGEQGWADIPHTRIIYICVCVCVMRRIYYMIRIHMYMYTYYIYRKVHYPSSHLCEIAPAAARPSKTIYLYIKKKKVI